MEHVAEKNWEAKAFEQSSILSDAVDIGTSLVAEQSATQRDDQVKALSHDLLRLSLELREFAPAIEQQRQLGLAMRHTLGISDGSEDGFPDDGRAWVGICGCGQHSFVKDPTVLAQSLHAELQRLNEVANCEQASPSHPDAFDVFSEDHIYPHSKKDLNDRTLVAVLHGVLGSSDFQAMHKILTDIVASHNMIYILRHMPGEGRTNDKFAINTTVLQGFGVALDIKNMEYLTVDDDSHKKNQDGDSAHENARVTQSNEISLEELSTPVGGISFNKLIERLPYAKDALVALHADLESEELEAASKNGELGQIKVWDMVNLGLQTTWKVLSDSDPLARWEDIAQNFPSRAKSLVNVRFPDDLLEQVEMAERSIDFPDGTVLVNGVSVNAKSESFNIFSLMETIRGELRAQDLAEAIIDGGSKLIEPLSMHIASADGGSGAHGKSNDPDAIIQSSGRRLDIRTDAKGAVIFFNNIEKDPMYAQWPEQIQALLQQSFQLATVRKNLYTVVMVIDPATLEGRKALQAAMYFLQQKMPIRIGVVFSSVPGSKENTGIDKNDEDRICGPRCFVALFLAGAKSSGRTAGINALGILSRAQTEHLTESNAVELFAQTLALITSSSRRLSEAEYREAAMEYLDPQNELTSSTMDRMNVFVQKKGLQAPCWTLNGLVYPGTDEFQSQLFQEVFKEQRVLMYQVHLQQVTDSTNVLKYILDHGKAIPRFNEVVLASNYESTFMPIPSFLRTDLVHYFYDAPGADVTIFLCIDEVSMASTRGNDILRDLVEFTSTRPENVRVAVLPMKIYGENSRLAAVLQALMEEDVVGVDALLSETEAAAIPVLSAEPWMTELSAHISSWKVAPLSIIANGRVIDASSESVSMTSNDFELLVSHERSSRSAIVQRALKSESATADVIMSLSPLAAMQATPGRGNLPMDRLRQLFGHLCFSTSEDDVRRLVIQVVIDPLSEAAPRVAGVVRVLRDKLQAHVDLVLTPKSSISAFPLSSYFRFLAANNEPDPARGGLYRAEEPPAARFYGLPQEQILTLKVFTPEPWIVYPQHTAGLDTDNIRLGRAKSERSTVRFVLSKLLVTGHCADAQTHAPTAGLQVQLHSLDPQSTVASDTLVMKNLGYMQLQAGPGVWKLSLAEGPSRDIYMIQSPELTPSRGLSKDYETTVVLRTFTSDAHTILARKRPGQESASLLDSLENVDEDKNQNNPHEADWNARKQASSVVMPGTKSESMWEWIIRSASEFLGLSQAASTTSKYSIKPIGSPPLRPSSENETIHVFSLASGALYERFLRIMMVSVTKATKNPVKFWLIENFLSPDFKVSLGALTEAYGFEVALVTYKWPQWLRRQTEKQRIIWGYKILFLDVLFPLDVPKVIYVDADQVVRADLKELWDMDLEGKPYGYTPFCASRKETLGFQFWRSGYWKDHLRELPYHISALYVVDLKRFRRNMVGDRLRALYDQLSRDPNSLSNLDQDLPNYAQHMVPIKSLPQEWLWCESWCSDDSKKDAKTIDLCNNPLHKEPKLDMAKRVISGELFPQSWVELDAEIKEVVALPQEESSA